MMVPCGQIWDGSGESKQPLTECECHVYGFPCIWTQIDDVSKCYVINLAAPRFQCEFKLVLLPLVLHRVAPCHPRGAQGSTPL